MNNGLRIPLKIVFYREDDSIIAHCLEFDLVGDGATREDALGSFAESIRLQIEEFLQTGNQDNLFSPAPGEYFRMFAAGTDARVGKARGQLGIHFDKVDVTEVDARDYFGNEQNDGDLALA